jgi:hypothetical protein
VVVGEALIDVTWPRSPLDALPLSAAGKVLKRELRSELADSASAPTTASLV